MRIPKTTVAALVAGLIVLTMVPAVAQLSNGDCELGVWNSPSGSIYRLTDWAFTWWGGTATNWQIGASDRDKHGGLKCGGAYIKSGQQTTGEYRYGMFSQTVSGLAAGAACTVRGWTRANTLSANSFVKLGARTGGAAEYTWSAENATDTWTEYTIEVTASAEGTVDIQAYIQNGTCGWNWTTSSKPCGMFDDVTIEQAPVPEPGGIVALLSGVIGLAGFGIRRRR